MQASHGRACSSEKKSSSARSCPSGRTLDEMRARPDKTATPFGQRGIPAGDGHPLHRRTGFHGVGSCKCASGSRSQPGRRRATLRYEERGWPVHGWALSKAAPPSTSRGGCRAAAQRITRAGAISRSVRRLPAAAGPAAASRRSTAAIESDSARVFSHLPFAPAVIPRPRCLRSVKSCALSIPTPASTR